MFLPLPWAKQIFPILKAKTNIKQNLKSHKCPANFVVEFFKNESPNRVGQRDLIRKSKITGIDLHPLLRYVNFKFFGFFNSASLFCDQLYSIFYWLNLRNRQN